MQFASFDGTSINESCTHFPRDEDHSSQIILRNSRKNQVHQTAFPGKIVVLPGVIIIMLPNINISLQPWEEKNITPSIGKVKT